MRNCLEAVNKISGAACATLLKEPAGMTGGFFFQWQWSNLRGFLRKKVFRSH
jgi:hypothetical protein